ncbi:MULTISPECIES: hypothetical protein [Aphanothece]|uniref:hypothetical protein n=1 Tax=Aphanothece TaxID=1121 RepID=UPI003984ECFA
MAEPSELNDEPSQEDLAIKNQSLAARLQIAVAIMVPFFGVVNTWQSQYLQTQLQQVRQEAERKQQFAGSIQSQLDNLTGKDPTKAKVALASLYTLAKEEGDKTILFTIAIVSQNEELKKTIASLVADDSAASQEFKDKLISKLGRIVDVHGRTSSASDSRPQNDLSTEKQLLEQLTQDKKNLSGWMYLGKSAAGGNQLGSDKTVTSSRVPGKNEEITLQTACNLRETAPTGRALGSIKGIVSKGTKARVQEIKRKTLDGSSEAVWGRVTISD